MAKSSKKINDLPSLEKEIYRLKLQAKRMEEKLDENFDYARENFISMAWSSILHYKISSQKWSSGIAQTILGHEGLQGALAKLLNFIIDRTSDGIDALLHGLFKKKDANEPEA